MRKGKPTLCEKCGFEISSFYFKQHQRVCDGLGPKGKRPKKDPPEGNRTRNGGYVPCGWNKGLTKETSEGVAKQAAQMRGRKLGRSPWDFLNEEQTASLKDKLRARLIRDGMTGYKHGVGRGRKGVFRGFKCDSSWELAWVVYNLEHNIPFQRCSRVFDYVDPEGVTRRYHPDFELPDGTLVEIKGWMSSLDKFKLSSLKGLPHKVLQKEDLRPILNYVVQKYGQRFWYLYE